MVIHVGEDVALNALVIVALTCAIVINQTLFQSSCSQFYLKLVFFLTMVGIIS